VIILSPLFIAQSATELSAITMIKRITPVAKSTLRLIPEAYPIRVLKNEFLSCFYDESAICFPA